MPFPTFQSVITSSTPDTVVFMTYVLPVIYIAFTVAVVVGVARLMIGLFGYIGDKLAGSGRRGSVHNQNYTAIDRRERSDD